MSAVVENVMLWTFTSYFKGSSKKIKILCQPKTIPSDFNEVLNNYTSRVSKVLSMGVKVIHMDFWKAFEVNNDFCEKDLMFLGLLIVQNKLKGETSSTLR